MALFGVALGEIAELIAGYFAVEAAEVAAAEGAALLGEAIAEAGAEEILAGAVTEAAGEVAAETAAEAAAEAAAEEGLGLDLELGEGEFVDLEWGEDAFTGEIETGEIGDPDALVEQMMGAGDEGGEFVDIDLGGEDAFTGDMETGGEGMRQRPTAGQGDIGDLEAGFREFQAPAGQGEGDALLGQQAARPGTGVSMGQVAGLAAVTTAAGAGLASMIAEPTQPGLRGSPAAPAEDQPGTQPETVDQPGTLPDESTEAPAVPSDINPSAAGRAAPQPQLRGSLDTVTYQRNGQERLDLLDVPYPSWWDRAKLGGISILSTVAAWLAFEGVRNMAQHNLQQSIRVYPGGGRGSVGMFLFDPGQVFGSTAGNAPAHVRSIVATERLGRTRSLGPFHDTNLYTVLTDIMAPTMTGIKKWWLGLAAVLGAVASDVFTALKH